VLSCVGRGLGAGLIPRPRSPTKYLKKKRKNPTPEKGIRKMRKKKKKKLLESRCEDKIF
jgi:hypothetical protein